MKEVLIYTTGYCPYCSKAKMFLDNLGVAYKAISLDEDAELRESLIQKHNWQTVPMIIVGDTFVGGFDDMIELHMSGELMKLVQGE